MIHSLSSSVPQRRPDRENLLLTDHESFSHSNRPDIALASRHGFMFIAKRSYARE